jgi:nucleotidyltransferase/DNA polymerase involved in DNA repair
LQHLAGLRTKRNANPDLREPLRYQIRKHSIKPHRGKQQRKRRKSQQGRAEAGRVCGLASYEARRFGVRSAMPAIRAEHLCSDAIFIPPDFIRYRAVCRAAREIFQRHTDLIEPLSLDEAYLDVTEKQDELVDGNAGSQSNSSSDSRGTEPDRICRRGTEQVPGEDRF